MFADDSLAIYLNDHLAGSAAGRDLADKIRSKNSGTPFGNFMADLVRQIEEDRDALAELMRKLQIEPSRLKQTGGSVLEKLSRIVFDERARESQDLSRLVELEMLSLGITGKMALWRTLRVIQDRGRRLPAIDIDRLIDRAQKQLEAVEQHRQDAAANALTG
jgi:hypothetical protein